MKLLVAGSRHFKFSTLFIQGLIQSIYGPQLPKSTISEIISGGAKGIDWLGRQFSGSQGINYREFGAEWDKHGKAAGPIRNKQMAEYSDELLLIWDGKSKGSANMKQEMLKLNKPVIEVVITTYNLQEDPEEFGHYK
jgi:hypothetical protein